MTVMHIQIPDELVTAFAKAFPTESLEEALQRLLRAEVEGRTAPTANRGLEIIEALRTIRECSPSTSNDQIRALRNEGRP
jgi:Arc/MetJ family transcription regulator